jgi:hypothetical protein
MELNLFSKWACLALFILLSGCASKHKIHGVLGGEPGAHKVTEVTDIASKDEILRYVSDQLVSAGVDLNSIQDGSVVIGRIYCCGGAGTSETENNVFVYVPQGLEVKQADILEFVEGQGPKGNGMFQLNTAVKVRHETGIDSGSCKWVPENPNLWMRVLYCPWMKNEGWIEGDTLTPEWYKIPDS